MQITSSRVTVLFSSIVSFLTFCLLHLLVIYKGVLKTTMTVVNLPIFSCSSISFYFIYFDALLLGTYTLRTVISSSGIDPFIM